AVRVSLRPRVRASASRGRGRTRDPGPASRAAELVAPRHLPGTRQGTPLSEPVGSPEKRGVRRGPRALRACRRIVRVRPAAHAGRLGRRAVSLQRPPEATRSPMHILLISAGGGGGSILRSVKASFRRDLATIQKADSRYAERLSRAVTT